MAWKNGGQTRTTKHAWRALRAQVLNRDGNQCARCGSQHNLEVDHIINVQRGGATTIDNLQTLCEACHQAKTAWESGEWRRKTRRDARTPIGLA